MTRIALACFEVPGWGGLTTATYRLFEKMLAEGMDVHYVNLVLADEVTRFISPPPTTLEGFERFIRWAHREREAGRYACFAVVPDDYDTAVGLFQVRQRDASFHTAEWGFVLGSAFWGSGLFTRGAERVMEFAFDIIHARRLEARAAVENGRGNGALRKIGAIQEAILRKSLLRGGVHHEPRDG